MPEVKRTVQVKRPVEFKSQEDIADQIEAIDQDIRDCFANTRGMVRGYGF